MIRFLEEAGLSDGAAHLVEPVLRMVCAALPGRTGGAESREPFAHTSGDDWLGDVGPAMSFEDREEWAEHRRGSCTTGLTVRTVHEYYTTSDPNVRDTRGRETRIGCYGWGAGTQFGARIGHGLRVSWALPDAEHDALLAAWTAFKAAHGLTVARPGEPTRA